MTGAAVPAPTQKTRGSGVFVRSAVVVGFAAIAGVGATSTGAAHATKPPLDQTDPTIIYEVTGTPGTAEYLTYEIDFGQAHETNVQLPWSKQFNASPSGHAFLLSAQGTGSGSITCRILVAGQLVSQATASGQPARTVCVPQNPPR